MNRSHTASDGLDFCVLHLLSCHAPSVVVLDIAFVPSDAWPVIVIVAPLATVCVAAFSGFLIVIEVDFKVPQRNVVVMHVVVEVNQTGVDGALGFNHWDIGQIHTAWDGGSSGPNAGNFSIADHDVALVQDVALTIHCDHSTFEQESVAGCRFWDVVASNDVHCGGRICASRPPSGCRRHLRKGAVVVFDV